MSLVLHRVVVGRNDKNDDHDNNIKKQCTTHKMCQAWLSGFYVYEHISSHPTIFKEGPVINSHFTDEDTGSQEVT